MPKKVKVRYIKQEIKRMPEEAVDFSEILRKVRKKVGLKIDMTTKFAIWLMKVMFLLL